MIEKRRHAVRDRAERRRTPRLAGTPRDRDEAFRGYLAHLLRVDWRHPLRWSVTSVSEVEGDRRGFAEVTLRPAQGRGSWPVRVTPGDVLFLRYRNPPALVDRVLRAVGACGRERIALRRASIVVTPGVRVAGRASEILAREVELRVASAATLARLGLAPRGAVSLPDALEAAPGRMGPRELVSLQPRVQPRSYELASVPPDPKRDPWSLYVSGVAETLVDAAGTPLPPLSGRCSGPLRAAQPGATVEGWWLPYPYRLGPLVGLPGPGIVIATGSALGCVAAWLRWHARPPSGPLWLIHGVRTWRPGSDRARLLSAALADGRLERLDIACSRPVAGEPARHVQDVLVQRSADIAAWLARGAWVYVTGHMVMGLQVRAMFLELMVSHRLAADAKDAVRVMAGWVHGLRFQTSLAGP